VRWLAGVSTVSLLALLCWGSPAQAATGAQQPRHPVATMSHCPRGLTSIKDANFTVWACNDGSGAALDESVTLFTAEGVFHPMTSLMGRPMADGAGSAGAGIDIYLLSAGQTVTRQNKLDTLNPTITNCSRLGGTLGIAEPDPVTRLGTGDSGYIVLPRPLLDACAADFRSVLVHEYFHVLSLHYNDTSTSCSNFWFDEASAKWAEWAYAPATATIMVYPWFTRVFQVNPQFSLTNSVGRSPYADFVWPFYMQQQHGAGAIARAWQGMAGRKGCAELNAAIDAQEAFFPNFDHFALEDFDSQLADFMTRQNKAWPVDFGPKFQDLHPLTGTAPAFPEVQPKTTQNSPGSDGQYPFTSTVPVALAPLSARYDHFLITTGASVELDLSKLSNQKNLGVNLIVEDYGSNRSHLALPVTGLDAKICLAADGAVGGEVYVILDNHGIGTPVLGSYKMIARSTCATSLSGTLNLKLHTDMPGISTADQTATLNATLTSSPGGWALQPSSTYSASLRLVFPQACPDQSDEIIQAAGSGKMLGGSTDLSIFAYESLYSLAPTLGSLFLATETAPATANCDTPPPTEPLAISSFFCPYNPAAPAVLGTYGPGDRAVGFNCSQSYTIGGATYDATVSGTLTATKPMACGLWRPGQAFCSINH
jgi:hypothetical protein